MTDIRRVAYRGSWRTLGESFGEQFRDETREFAERRMDRLVAFVSRHDPGRNLSRRALIALAAELEAPHRAYDERIWSEFEGIARGAGVSIPELLIANGFTDVRDYVLFSDGDFRRRTADHLGECSVFLAPAELTDCGPLLGQTWDMHPDARPFTVVVERRPDGAPATLGLTTVGCLCLIGMNEHGVAVGNSNLVPTDPEPGVNYLFAITRALTCRTATEALDAIESTPRLSGHNFYVADERTGTHVETTAAWSRNTPLHGTVIVRANHYTAKELRSIEFTGQDLAHSRWRQARLEAGFAAASAKPPLTVDACWALLADNTRGDGAICNEDYECAFGEFATVATIVQCPRRREIHVCDGGARLGARRVMTL